MMLTVDSITGGNRERDLRTGFSIPFQLTLGGILQFVIKPTWAINYLTHERFKLPQLNEHVDMRGGAGPSVLRDRSGRARSPLANSTVTLWQASARA